MLKLEQNREQQKVKALGEARSLVAVHAEKLQQLIEYRAEYELMVSQEGRQGIAASRLQGYHQFLNRLSTAIAQQQEQLELVQQKEQLAQNKWFDQRGAVKRMDSLIERNVHQERKEEDSREQKMLDEQAQRLQRSRRPLGFN